MNENHCNINSERTGNILKHKELNFLKIQGDKYYTNSETKKSPEITIHGNW